MSRRKQLEQQRQAVATMRELLLDPTKRRQEAENIPAMWFRDILASHGIMPGEWEKLLDRHYRLLYKDDVQKISQAKTNLQRALVKPNLTWARYFKFLEILGVEAMTFTQTLETKDGRSFNHVIKVKNRYSLSKVKGSEQDEE